jgi:hypothetical protein
MELDRRHLESEPGQVLLDAAGEATADGESLAERLDWKLGLDIEPGMASQTIPLPLLRPSRPRAARTLLREDCFGGDSFAHSGSVVVGCLDEVA